MQARWRYTVTTVNIPWDSLPLLILTLNTITVTPSIFLSFHMSTRILLPSRSLCCPGDSLWHWQKDLSSRSLNARRDVYHGSVVPLSSLSCGLGEKKKKEKKKAFRPMCPCLYFTVWHMKQKICSASRPVCPQAVILEIQEIGHFNGTERVCCNNYREARTIKREKTKRERFDERNSFEVIAF